jgi:ribosomal protein S2
MKLKKIKIKSQRLFELHLIKSRIYEQPIEKSLSKSLPDVDLTDIIFNFKTALSIIFKYHTSNKRILFVGVPKSLEVILNRKSRHVAISNSLDMKKVRLETMFKSNLGSDKQISKLEKNFLLPKLTSKPDLVVVFEQNRSKNDFEAIVQESYINRIPIIKFNSNLQERYRVHSYSVPGNVKGSSPKVINSLFSVLLNTVIKR